MQRSRTEDHRDERRIERHGRRADIGNDARLLPHGHGGDDERVGGRRKREGEQHQQDARAHRLAVRVHGNGEDATEHEVTP